MERDVPARCRWLTRDLDPHDSNEPIEGVRSVDSDSLIMIDPNTGILKQPGDVVDRGVVNISVERHLARVRARIRVLGGGDNTVALPINMSRTRS